MSLLLLYAHELVGLKSNQILGGMRLLVFSRAVSVQTRRRAAALLEVLGIYLAGAYLSDPIAKLLLRWRYTRTVFLIVLNGAAVQKIRGDFNRNAS